MTAPTGLSELEVWEAFRSLRLEGQGLFPSMISHLLSRKALGPPGPTLEIGAGDAELWRQGGGAFVDSVLAAGPLHLTDADPALVARLRAMPLVQRPGVTVDHADVMALPFPASKFARVLAMHVLHWCGTPSNVEQAVQALARSLLPNGVAFIVTVDEQVHMVELYRLLGAARAALIRRGVACPAMPPTSPRVLPFCAGNAPSFLSAAFARIQRFDWRYAHLVDQFHPALRVPSETFLVGYVRTLPFVREAVASGQLPEEFFDEVATLFLDEIGRGSFFRMSRCDVLYECRVA